jgi:hypothetical protein
VNILLKAVIPRWRNDLVTPRSASSRAGASPHCMLQTGAWSTCAPHFRARCFVDPGHVPFVPSKVELRSRSLAGLLCGHRHHLFRIDDQRLSLDRRPRPVRRRSTRYRRWQPVTAQPQSGTEVEAARGENRSVQTHLADPKSPGPCHMGLEKTGPNRPVRLRRSDKR